MDPMKQNLTHCLWAFALLAFSPQLGIGQSFNLNYMHEQARAPISNVGLENGNGLSMILYLPVTQPYHPTSLVSVDAGIMFDFLNHGSLENSMLILDPDGFVQDANIENSSMTMGGAVRFSLADRFAVRPYLNAELGARTQRTYESWLHGNDEDCPVENTVLRSWTPSIGMGAGVMVKLTPAMNLDLGVTWRQTGALNFVPLESIQETEKGSYQYDYNVERARGQFLGIKVGINFLLDDCRPGCDHSSCCAPSRHSISDSEEHEDDEFFDRFEFGDSFD